MHVRSSYKKCTVSQSQAKLQDCVVISIPTDRSLFVTFGYYCSSQGHKEKGPLSSRSAIPDVYPEFWDDNSPQCDSPIWWGCLICSECRVLCSVSRTELYLPKTGNHPRWSICSKIQWLIIVAVGGFWLFGVSSNLVQVGAAVLAPPTTTTTTTSLPILLQMWRESSILHPPRTPTPTRTCVATVLEGLPAPSSPPGLLLSSKLPNRDHTPKLAKVSLILPTTPRNPQASLISGWNDLWHYDRGHLVMAIRAWPQRSREQICEAAQRAGSGFPFCRRIEMSVQVVWWGSFNVCIVQRLYSTLIVIYMGGMGLV